MHPPVITDDFNFQLEFVAGAAWRLMAMQDSDPLSPSFGCFHYAYWRDKTSEFPDARFQEAGAALALLSLPQFDGLRDAGRLGTADRLGHAFSAALRAWENQQYAEGCWDEWYKGERGFAATEFTMIAYGIAAMFLGEKMATEDRRRLEEVMARAARWLASRDDRVKSNHEAAAAAALAIAAKVTGIDEFRADAQGKLADTLARQTEEGWFPEVGGMDLGYCFVLMDYLMLYEWVTGDETPVPAMKRLLTFVLPHLHPDLSVAPDAGLCLNAYVGRLGLGLLSRFDGRAAAILGALQAHTPGLDGVAPILADDLRLARWSYLPATVHLLREHFQMGDATTPPYPDGWTIHADAAVAAYHGDDLHVYFAAAGGGSVRVFQGRTLVMEDGGFDLEDSGGKWTTRGYDRSRHLRAEDDGVTAEIAFGRPAYMFPGFLSRLILRLGSMSAWGSRLLRSAIDFMRLNRGSAANQSAAPMASKSGGGPTLRRQVAVENGHVCISDEIRSTGAARSTTVVPRLVLSGKGWSGKALYLDDSVLLVEKQWPSDDPADGVSLTWKNG